LKSANYLKKIQTAFFLAYIIFLSASCNNINISKKEVAEDVHESKDSGSMKSCNAKPVKDPNHPKPMALMMRMMADNADSIRAQLLRNENPDKLRYPFQKFYLLEPTDSSVLEMQFFENARFYQEAYTDFFNHPNEQKRYFNVLIEKCVNCHEHYCNGPLKRIRKLYIDM